MKKILHNIAAGALLLTLFACANPAGPSASSDSSSGSSGDSSASSPMAAYAGTWVQSYSETSGSVTTTFNMNLKIAADGSFLEKDVTTTATGGSSNYRYHDNKGTISLSGDYIEMKITAERTQESGPFADDSSGWEQSSKARGMTVLASGSKIYPNALKAQGSVSGIVGSWAYDEYDSTAAKPYKRVVIQFDSKDYIENDYTSATSDYPSTPSASYSGSYTLYANGTMTTTSSSETSPARYYKIIGSYVVFGGLTSLDEYAFVKQ